MKLALVLSGRPGTNSDSSFSELRIFLNIAMHNGASEVRLLVHVVLWRNHNTGAAGLPTCEDRLWGAKSQLMGWSAAEALKYEVRGQEESHEVTGPADSLRDVEEEPTRATKAVSEAVDVFNEYLAATFEIDSAHLSVDLSRENIRPRAGKALIHLKSDIDAIRDRIVCGLTKKRLHILQMKRTGEHELYIWRLLQEK
jgi:hypothetical protein